MSKICARSKIKNAIKHHQQMYKSILYARGFHSLPDIWLGDEPEHDELFHRADCEIKCAERLEKLLERYE